MLLSAPPPWAELRIFSWAGLLPGHALIIVRRDTGPRSC